MSGKDIFDNDISEDDNEYQIEIEKSNQAISLLWYHSLLMNLKKHSNRRLYKLCWRRE